MYRLISLVSTTALAAATACATVAPPAPAEQPPPQARVLMMPGITFADCPPRPPPHIPAVWPASDGIVVGTVHYLDGTPMAGRFRLRRLAHDDSTAVMVSTDPEGRFAVAIAPGRYYARFTPLPARTLTPILVVEGEPTPVHIRINPWELCFEQRSNAP